MSGNTAPFCLKYHFFLTAISGSDPLHNSRGQVLFNQSFSCYIYEAFTVS